MEYQDEYYHLIKASQRGDEKAMAELVQAHAQAINQYLLNLCGNIHLAEDLAQDTFLRALLALKDYQFRAPFKAWLFRIAINLFRDYRRRKTVRAIVASYNDDFQSGEEGLTIATSSNPHTELERKERFVHLYQALDKLPEYLRNVVILRDLQELTYEEIAKMLQWRIGTVKSRLFRARKELTTLLSDFMEGE